MMPLNYNCYVFLGFCFQLGYLPLVIFDAFVDVFLGLGLFYGWVDDDSISDTTRIDRVGATFMILSLTKWFVYVTFFLVKFKALHLNANPFKLPDNMKAIASSMGWDLISPSPSPSPSPPHPHPHPHPHPLTLTLTPSPSPPPSPQPHP